MSDIDSQARILRCTARIVAAHISHNAMAPNGLAALIQSVHATLTAVISAAPSHADAPGAAVGKLVPAVPIKRSIHRDYLISLEDGTKVKMLKRHLATSYGMTPEQYRTKWGLPSDYPMVAPAYAERRSALAKESGLGRKPKAAEVPPPRSAPLVSADEPAEPADEAAARYVAHTAESVFANFRPPDNDPAAPKDASPDAPEGSVPAKAPDPVKRKRFAQQSARQMPRKHAPTPQ